MKNIFVNNFNSNYYDTLEKYTKDLDDYNLWGTINNLSNNKKFENLYVVDKNSSNIQELPFCQLMDCDKILNYINLDESMGKTLTSHVIFINLIKNICNDNLKNVSNVFIKKGKEVNGNEINETEQVFIKLINSINNNK